MKPEDILVIGDSWSSAVVAGEGDRRGWPQMLGIPEANVQAVAGSTAAQWAADWEGRLTRACNTPARCVILSLMGNDMRQALQDGVLAPDELMAGMSALRRVFDLVREGRESMVVLLYAGAYDAYSRDEYAVYALNLVIRATTFLPGTDFLDSERVLLPEHFEVGDIHPNWWGHEAIARAMARMLKIKTRWGQLMGDKYRVDIEVDHAEVVDALAECEREAGVRRRVYPRLEFFEADAGKAVEG